MITRSINVVLKYGYYDQSHFNNKFNTDWHQAKFFNNCPFFSIKLTNVCDHQIMEQARKAGESITYPTHETFWGAYSGHFETLTAIYGRLMLD